MKADAPKLAFEQYVQAKKIGNHQLSMGQVLPGQIKPSISGVNIVKGGDNTPYQTTQSEVRMQQQQSNSYPAYSPLFDRMNTKPYGESLINVQSTATPANSVIWGLTSKRVQQINQSNNTSLFVPFEVPSTTPIRNQEMYQVSECVVMDPRTKQCKQTKHYSRVNQRDSTNEEDYDEADGYSLMTSLPVANKPPSAMTPSYKVAEDLFQHIYLSKDEILPGSLSIDNGEAHLTFTEINNYENPSMLGVYNFNQIAGLKREQIQLCQKPIRPCLGGVKFDARNGGLMNAMASLTIPVGSNAPSYKA
jgi:hypothetical protein